MKRNQPRDRSANKPGRTMRNAKGGRSARHVSTPAGSKIARLISEGRSTGGSDRTIVADAYATLSRDRWMATRAKRSS